MGIVDFCTVYPGSSSVAKLGEPSASRELSLVYDLYVIDRTTVITTKYLLSERCYQTRAEDLNLYNI